MSGTAPILVTGFEPFGGETTNASWEAVKLLPEEVAGHKLVRMLLPVEFGRSGDMVCEQIEAIHPAAVIAVGEAGGRAHVSVERVAMNLMRASTPDNVGFQPEGEPVVAGGPDALLATLPVDDCVEAARTAGVPTDASETAGLYVCNQVMYRILNYLRQTGRGVPAGFVHVPHTPEQVLRRREEPFVPARYSARAIEAIVARALC